MDWPNLALVLEKLGVDTDVHTPYRQGQVQVPCVLASWFHQNGTDSRASLTIKYGEPPTLFKCFTCGEQGKLYELVESFASMKKDKELAELAMQLMKTDKVGLKDVISKAATGIDAWVRKPVSAKPIKLSREVLSTFQPVLMCREARDYLYGRDIEDEVALELFDLRYDAGQNRIVCPVYSKSGDLLGAVGRRIDDREPRYYNYFNFESGKTLGGLNLITDNPRLLVCEGFFDAVNCYSWAKLLRADVVCTWKAEISKHQANQIMVLDKSISVWYDSDHAGDNGWIKAKKTLRKTYGLRRAVLPEGKDVGELKSPEFRAIFTSVYGE
jgi:DNA primase